MAVGRRNARHDPRPLASDEHVSESKNPRSHPVLGPPIREENGHLAWHDASIPPALALWLRSGTRRKERLFVVATSLLRAARPKQLRSDEVVSDSLAATARELVDLGEAAPDSATARSLPSSVE